MNEHFVEAEELQAWLDSELPAERMAEVEQHVGTCSMCTALVEDLKRVSATLQQWQVEDAPTSLRKPEMIHGLHMPAWLSLRFVSVASGVAIVAVLVAGVWIFDNSWTVYKFETPPKETVNMAVQPSLNAPPKAKEESLAAERGDSATVRNQRFPQTAASTAPDWLGQPKAAEPLAPEGYLLDKKSAFVSTGSQRMIAHEVSMVLETNKFDSAKKQVLEETAAAGGYVAYMDFREEPDQAKKATVRIQVPTKNLPLLLEKLRPLGRVLKEELSSDDVTERFVDLEARLRNARATEERLIDILRQRTGKVRDVLEVEREISRKREEIELMDAQRKNLLNRVQLATVHLILKEEYKARLEPAPVGTVTRLRNAFVQGYKSFVDFLLGFVFFLGHWGLYLLFWYAVFWLVWRRWLRPLARRLELNRL